MYCGELFSLARKVGCLEVKVMLFSSHQNAQNCQAESPKQTRPTETELRPESHETMQGSALPDPVATSREGQETAV
jgi:hypothetical protein